MKNHYSVLQINRNASKEEIKKAFRALAQQYHPDKNNNDKNTEIFREINEAKQILLDDTKRFYYDIQLNKSAAHYSFTSDKNKSRRNYHSEYYKAVKVERIKKVFLSGSVLILIGIVCFMFADVFQEGGIQEFYSPEGTENPERRREEKKAVYINSVGDFKLNKSIGNKQNKTNFKQRKKADDPLLSANTKILEGNIASMELGPAEINKILNKINVEAARLNYTSRCVQIRKTNGSNVQNTFVLADYLKAKGFTISGRAVVNGNIQGVTISTGSSCIIVTVGTL